MSKSREQKVRIPYKLYDDEGRELRRIEIDLTLFKTHSELGKAFQSLIKNLISFDQAHIDYINAITNDNSQIIQTYTTLKAFFSPHHKSAKQLKLIFRQRSNALFKAINAFSTQVVKLKTGGVFGRGANQADYTAASSWLRRIGDYAESKIIETPWHNTIEKNNYLLTALSESPEAFLQVQQDETIIDHINQLNATKSQFLKASINEDGSNLLSEAQHYISHINHIKPNIEHIGTDCSQQIRRIEAKRASRWGITNFFIDLFWDEKSELNQLKNRRTVAASIEKNFHLLTKNLQPLETQNVFQQTSAKLLQHPAHMTQHEIVMLRSAVKTLESQNSQVNIHFSDTLKKAILQNVEQLSNSAEAIPALTKQFTLLTEKSVNNIKLLNDVRVTIHQSIIKKLQAFEQPAAALQFIHQLKQAEPACLDQQNELATLIEIVSKDYAAWEVLQTQGPQLLTQTLNYETVLTLQTIVLQAAKSSLPRMQQAASDYNAALQAELLKNIGALQQSEEVSPTIIALLEQQFKFYGSHALYHEESFFSETKRLIRNHIIQSFSTYTQADKALAYISRWEKVNEEVIKNFDITLYQAIQDKKNQYKSLHLLQTAWSELLDDKKANALTEVKIEEFIAATLWLDKPTSELNNPIVNVMRQLKKTDLKPLQQIAKEKIAELKAVLLSNLADLSQGSLSDEKRKALKYRLKFICQANAMYTLELKQLRADLIKMMKKQIKQTRNLQESKRYLDDLYVVLPSELKKDETLSDAIKAVKLKMVKAHFSTEQHKLHKKYQTELEFLQTGNWSIWGKIEGNFDRHQLKALTQENIHHWHHRFLRDYISELNSQADNAVAMASDGGEEKLKDKQILRAYLHDSIVEDMRSIANLASLDLTQLADMRRQRALAKLDKIFGLEPSKASDVNLFMLRYFALAEYQQYYSAHASLVKAGSDFVRQFHHMAQHEGGFTTQIIAKLPIDALEAMYRTCANNPNVNLSELDLKSNIIGEVSTDQNTHIQIPKYLLLTMVLELIVADMDALLRGNKIDTKLLNDRITFAMPKLEKQVSQENTIDQNSNALREVILAVVEDMKPERLKLRYEYIVTHQMEKGFITHNNWGLVTNFPACEAVLLKKIKFTLSDELNVISGLNLADLDYRNEEESVKKVNEMLVELQTRLTNLQALAASSKPSLEETTLHESITSFEEQKRALFYQIEMKKAKIKWVNAYQEQLDHAQRLLQDDTLTLKEFIANLDPAFYALFDSNLAAACHAIKQTITASALLNDENFIQTLQTIQHDVQDPSKNSLDIVRALPESIIRELSPACADTVRQLQYRCADRFKHLLVRMLDKNHLLSIFQESINKTVSEENGKPQATRFWGSWFQAEKRSKIENKSTAENCLQTAFKNINSTSFKHMLEQLTSTADVRKISLNHLYTMKGMSAPIAIQKRVDSQPSLDIQIGHPTKDLRMR